MTKVVWRSPTEKAKPPSFQASIEVHCILTSNRIYCRCPLEVYMKRIRFVTLLLVCLWGAVSVAAPEEGLSPAEQAARYREAAEQGDAEAQNNLGTCYATGEGAAQSYEEAVKWWRKAAEQGDLLAQCNLGMCYLNGEGVRRSDKEAVKWLRKAAEQGDAQAQRALGACYAYGRGVKRSREQAKVWLRKAVEQGDREARGLLLELQANPPR